MSLDWKKLFKKKEKVITVEPLTKEEEVRNALKKLQELKHIWSFLLNRYSTKQLRKQMRNDFIYSDTFGQELIDDTIEYYKNYLAKQNTIPSARVPNDVVEFEGR